MSTSAPAPEDLTPTPTRKRLRDLNRILLLPPIGFAGVVVVAVESESWTDALLLGVGVAASLLAFWRWSADRVAPVLMPCLLVAAIVWPVSVLVTPGNGGVFGLTLIGSLAVPQLKRWHLAAATALVGYVATGGALRLVVERDDVQAVLIDYVLFPAGAVAILTGLMFPNKRFYDVVDDLELARDREAELAVSRERIRFAGDLHDIQGHTLHLVKLKATLAQKLVRTDPDRAEEELREIHALVSDTIAQTGELVYARRRLNLPAELENAGNLFEAAGIRVRVLQEGEIDPATSEGLGQVLRETTTNVLRHAQATEVTITLTPTTITVENDGAPGDGTPELRGLAALARRLAERGGDLTAERGDGRFRTTATLGGHL